MNYQTRTAYLPADVNWHNWGTFFTDEQLWQPVVERICHHIGSWPAKQIDAGYPGSCAVFVVDRRFVVKLFPPLFPHDFAREREVYRLLGGTVPVIPGLIADGVYQDQIDWPYLIFEFRPGEPIREHYTDIGVSNRRALAKELGQIIRQVHQTPLTDVQQFDPRPEAWRHFLVERKLSCLPELREKTSLSEKVLAEVESLLYSNPWLPDEFVPVLLNADLTDDHLLLVKQGEAWEISALIDWADAEVGAPEYEWVAYWFVLCRQDKDMFRETLRAYDPKLVLNDVFRWRMLAYTFLHRFGAEIIAYVWDRGGTQSVNTLDQLLDRLWPAF